MQGRDVSWKDLQFHKLRFDQELGGVSGNAGKRETFQLPRYNFRLHSHVSHRWHGGNYNKVSMDEQFHYGWTSSKWAPAAISTVLRQSKDRNRNLGQFPTLLEGVLVKFSENRQWETISSTRITVIESWYIVDE